MPTDKELASLFNASGNDTPSSSGAPEEVATSWAQASAAGYGYYQNPFNKYIYISTPWGKFSPLKDWQVYGIMLGMDPMDAEKHAKFFKAACVKASMMTGGKPAPLQSDTVAAPVFSTMPDKEPKLSDYLMPTKKAASVKALPPLTPDQWINMSAKAQWDSVVALRGPDFVNSDGLKWLTSSVLRHRMSKVMRVGGMVNKQLPCVIIPKSGGNYAEIFGKSTGFNASHFMGHIQEAASWLKVPVITISPERFKSAIFDGTPYLPALSPDIPVEYREYLQEIGLLHVDSQ
jgi:hypothetical protein